MEKKSKIALLAIIVVVIVIAGAFAMTLPEKKSKSGTIYYTVVPWWLQGDQIAAGSISGGVVPEPYVSDAIASGSSHVIAWSGEIWENHPCCVIAVRDSFAADNPELVTRVLKANIVATQWILDTLEHPDSENYSKLMDMGASFSGVTTDVVENAAAHIVFTTALTQEVKDALEFYVEQFVKFGVLTNSTITDRGFTDAADFIDTVVNTTYLDAASTIQPSSTILGEVRLGFLTGDLHQFSRVVAMNEDLWGGKDLFAVYGVDVSSPNQAGYAVGPNEMDAFAANAIDMGYLGSPPTLQKRLIVDIKVTIVSLVNAEGSAIIASNDIDNMGDLVNKTVGTPGIGSIQHLLLWYYADHEGYEIAPKV
jgi:NitT/TauT family transport system substrate-binding protein